MICHRQESTRSRSFFWAKVLNGSRGVGGGGVAGGLRVPAGKGGRQKTRILAERAIRNRGVKKKKRKITELVQRSRVTHNPAYCVGVVVVVVVVVVMVVAAGCCEEHADFFPFFKYRVRWQDVSHDDVLPELVQRQARCDAAGTLVRLRMYVF